ncbi:MAG: ribulose bisphosphate carboxylase small subunit [Rhodospirillaceae bacterium]|jgi:ribulose-bisphosphate carboxylase small chain|nr:ribulose bisphosphate carboxylase small subunit [Rhodospirillaceae bacterium]
MTEVQDYPSRLNDAESKRFEAFSYLPPMDASQIRKQVEYAVSKGWNCAIEHAEPERAGKSYWYMWKLPMFGEKGVDFIMREAEACHRANPGNHVRVIGYDNKAQSQGMSLVIYRA